MAICRLINVHQVPFFALDSSKRNKSPQFIVRELSWQLSIPLLAMLAMDDWLREVLPIVGVGGRVAIAANHLDDLLIELGLDPGIDNPGDY